MKTKVRMENELPAECPRCEAETEQLCIDNDEGMECLDCGCWFDAEPNGTIVFARHSRPVDL
jgi:hypothetical protein